MHPAALAQKQLARRVRPVVRSSLTLSRNSLADCHSAERSALGRRDPLLACLDPTYCYYHVVIRELPATFRCRSDFSKTRVIVPFEAALEGIGLQEVQ